MVKLFELRRKTKELERLVNDLNIKNQSLEEFARVAAHDIKAPINNILSLSEYINQEESGLSKEGHELLSMISTSAKDLGQLIDGILRLSRSSELLNQERSTLDLPDFIASLLNMLCLSTKTALTLDIKVEKVFTNKIALEQILINLIANSLKYNNAMQPWLKVSAEEDETRIIFSVSDNGPGISEKDQKRIFTIFQTTTNKAKDGTSGTGIGLATVKALVEGLGGNIWVESKIGDGATFTFSVEKI